MISFLVTAGGNVPISITCAIGGIGTNSRLLPRLQFHLFSPRRLLVILWLTTCCYDYSSSQHTMYLTKRRVLPSEEISAARGGGKLHCVSWRTLRSTHIYRNGFALQSNSVIYREHWLLAVAGPQSVWRSMTCFGQPNALKLHYTT